MADEVRSAGDELLSRISTEMVRAQKKYFGRGPTSAKSYLLDDFLLIVMRDNRTVAEQTMLEFGHADRVREFRQHFENEMTSRLVGMVEELTGRSVLGYQSQILFEPDVVVEMFFFDKGFDGIAAGDARADAEHDDVAQTIAADERDQAPS